MPCNCGCTGLVGYLFFFFSVASGTDVCTDSGAVIGGAKSGSGGGSTASDVSLTGNARCCCRRDAARLARSLFVRPAAHPRLKVGPVRKADVAWDEMRVLALAGANSTRPEAT